jgi:hypothetical protein
MKVEVYEILDNSKLLDPALLASTLYLDLWVLLSPFKNFLLRKF